MFGKRPACEDCGKESPPKLCEKCDGPIRHPVLAPAEPELCQWCAGPDDEDLRDE